MSCVAGIAGLYVAERLVVSDQERIEAALTEMAAAFERRDEPQVLSYISPGQPDLHNLIRWGFANVTTVDDLSLTDVSIELQPPYSEARSHFRANGRVHVTVLGDIGRQATRWNLTWRREGDDWKIVGIQRLNPITGEPIDTRTTRP